MAHGAGGGFASNLVPADNNNFGPRLAAAVPAHGKVHRARRIRRVLLDDAAVADSNPRTNPPLNLRFTNPLGTLDGTSTVR